MLAAQLDNKSFLHLLSKHINAHITEEGYVGALVDWHKRLGAQHFVTVMCGSLAARLLDPAFNTVLVDWHKRLGAQHFSTWMSNSLAARLLDPAFNTFLTKWHQTLSIEKFTAIMKGGIAARFGILDQFMIFYSACPRWTQKMTFELCRRVPKDQPIQVIPKVWENIAKM